MRTLSIISTLLVLGAVIGCSADPEPVITPPQPQFADTTQPPNPIDHRIFADVDPLKDAVWIEWKGDSSHNTTGYRLLRSEDSLIGAGGLLKNGTIVALFESSNLVLDPLPTAFRDTIGIHPNARYWYQLQALYRSPTNKVTYSTPTSVDNTTSFKYETRVVPLNPAGYVSLPSTGLKFLWEDPEKGGTFQIIVERTDRHEYVWSALLQEYEEMPTVEYPMSAVPLVPGGQYRWRVKRIHAYGGSSSPWMTFTVQQ